jgi:hypothetical protein
MQTEEQEMLRTTKLVQQLATNQVAQQRYGQNLNARLNAKDEQIALQQRLIDSHEVRIERLEAMLLPQGKKIDA